ncbi:phage portal protein family protein [Serinibacter salmoneus]|uniref:Portal protein n=1 Tax=Serinibacter salmoneus TaxID=556530 RepID=A0A2A9D0S9_9MICO|nr:hypothetical protein [Serinibacter salmoneus]PFG19865.1 hypothetical protein ATL40_1441 [Serinibacter salmoneus]
MTAPTTPSGYTSEVTSQWWDDAQHETAPELRWPNNIEVYDKMRRTDAQVMSVLRAVTLPIRRTAWRLDPNGARDEVVELVAEDLGLPIVGRQTLPPVRARDRFSWKEHLYHALLMLPFGHSPFEQVYRIEDGQVRLRKLEWRPPRTISKVEVAADGGLVALEQVSSTTGRAARMPVDRLVVYVNDREGGNWLGQSLLRTAYKPWILKDRMLRVQAQTVDRNGMGVPVYTASDREIVGESAEDRQRREQQEVARGQEIASSVRSGQTAGASLAPGAKLELLGVSGTLPDATPPIRYYDEQIARSVLAHFLNLGTETGSWALGSTFANFFVESLQALAGSVADVATQHVVEDLVDLNWGERERAPRVVFDAIGSQRDATAEAVKVLIDARAITPDEPLEDFLRLAYGLPAAAPSTRQPDVDEQEES